MDAENIVDIRSALRNIAENPDIHKGECFNETLRKMEEIPIPSFDY